MSTLNNASLDDFRVGMTVYIYALSDPITNEIRYVGKTINLKQRLKYHTCVSLRDHRSAWIKSLRARGLKPQMDILEAIENSDDNDWQEYECFWIKYLSFIGCRLCNLDSGGREGKVPNAETREKLRSVNLGKKMSAAAIAKTRAAHLGTKRSEEARARMREGCKRRPPLSKETLSKIGASLKGRTISAEQRAKISALHRGKVVTEEQKAKQRAAMLGRKASEETRVKMRASQKGKIFTEATREKLRAATLSRYHAG